MTQSSTDPCVVVIAGGLFGSNRVGVAPSTVMKKFVGLAGLVGSEMTSEKYSLRCVVGLAAASPANLVPVKGPVADSIVGSDGPFVAFCRMATVLSGSLSPAGPVSTLRVFNTALLTAADGPVTMNSAR